MATLGAANAGPALVADFPHAQIHTLKRKMRKPELIPSVGTFCSGHSLMENSGRTSAEVNRYGTLTPSGHISTSKGRHPSDNFGSTDFFYVVGNGCWPGTVGSQGNCVAGQASLDQLPNVD